MSLFTSAAGEKRLALRAGLFVAIGLAVAGVVVFFIGQESRLFQRQHTYRTYFANVQGLSDQSPVWLGGLEVGKVTGIYFSEDPNDPKLEVRLQVASKYGDRVKQDSLAQLTSMGVLGDKAVDISLGSPASPPVEPGGVLASSTSGDLTNLLKSASEVMDNSVAISKSLLKTVDAYGDPQLARDVQRSMASLRGVLEQVQNGDGMLHALIYDKDGGREVRRLMASASSAAQRVDGAVGHVEVLLREVRTGDGTAHALIYGDEGAIALRELGEAAGQLAGLIEDAKKSPNGAVHQLVYGDASGMFADLGSAAEDLKKITATVAKGEGTLGGLISDPTVYEDLREVLGNVKRNRILRALVRFSLDNRKDLEQMGKVQRVEPKAEAPKPAEPPQPVAAPPPVDAAPPTVPAAE
ncbi:MCE family protein [Myxococcus llanfairpwllgwyngyllgogerychwyrndrobwllllantysiliogogogochensis]|uniref:MCE family protein n=1 Tax=Myxococcus llanfairpwllgwyngyllgogerychwyrndrobwllllantysiliogogogochensis TaxID=2590453 RepID=A0A540X6D0_9BACT|nr:MlaD family protein [Myxococcus llanfairpwllgwyngyllgogerychwyrndrobwllllantysiliogogogochensis]TQF16284.1 MCE family protein [Myxococcus llanfairpwllgwyngyllgogerychwyrndrobwllllantysiliogogogochensis]